VHIRATFIKSEITLAFGRGGGVGSPTKKGGVGEVDRCSVSKRRDSHRGWDTDWTKAVQGPSACRMERCRGPAQQSAESDRPRAEPDWAR
jgi:hypothetical protein